MKKQQTEKASFDRNEEQHGITRREFLKGTAGFVLMCGVSFKAGNSYGLFDSDPGPVGPQLRSELEIISHTSGADVCADGQLCFTVNETGQKLLHLANGQNTLQQIIRISGLDGQAESVADFYLTLGKAGYLTARLEVDKVAAVL